jgi:hypothetical protein
MDTKKIDNLVMDVVVGNDLKKKECAINEIWQAAYKEGVHSASIHDLYRARGENRFGGMTVPAINLRVLTYDLSVRFSGPCSKSMPAPSFLKSRVRR